MRSLKCRSGHSPCCTGRILFVVFFLGVVQCGLALDYFVNDAFTNGDVYCTAFGNDANSGTSPSSPKASLQAILDAYDIGPGDTVWVDAGLYESTNSISISSQDAGSSNGSVTICGAPYGKTVLNKLSQTNWSSVVSIAGADYVTLRNLVAQGGDCGVLVVGTCARLESVTAQRAGTGFICGGYGSAFFDHCVAVSNNCGLWSHTLAQWNGGVSWGNATQFWGSVRVSNSVVVGGTVLGSDYISGDYNIFWDTIPGGGYTSLDQMLNAGTSWRHCLNVDPQLADPANMDFHPRSTAGRFDPAIQAWVVDTVNSPCIDAGDPAASFAQEPMPNGGRRNIGLYGNTAEASRSPTNAQLLALTFNSGGTAAGTQLLTWAASGSALGGAVSLDYTPDAGATWLGVASNVPASTQMYVWNTTQIPNTTQALWRVVLEQNPNVWDVNDHVFVIGDGATPSTNPSLECLTFNAGGTAAGTQLLTWAASGSALGGTVSLDYTPDAGATWSGVASNVPASTQMYVWNTTQIPSTTQALWRVVLEQDPNVWDVNDHVFIISNITAQLAATLQALSFNTGGAASGVQWLRWTAGGAATSGTVRVDYSENAGVTWVALGSHIPALASSYIWDTTAWPDSTQSLWRVVLESNTNVCDANDQVFSVTNEAVIAPPFDPGTAVVHYVAAYGVTPVYPYTNWATAATTIQEAVDAALPGEVVLVSNGVYATGARQMGMLNRVVITKAITVQSVNGPTRTFIVGVRATNSITRPYDPNAMRCVYMSAGNLNGFTLTRGSTASYVSGGEDDGGGAYASGGTLSNCIISGNYGVYGGGVYGGTLNNCVISRNGANAGGGAYGAVLNNCIITSNSAYRGGGASGSSLNGCKVLGNSAYRLSGSSANLTGKGGGAYRCRMNSCLVQGNNAVVGGGACGSIIANCTIIGNSASAGGGTYYYEYSNYPPTQYYSDPYLSGPYYTAPVTESGTVKNSIVHSNTASSYSANWHGQYLEYCCTTPRPSGSGNITNDPMFSADGWHIEPESPCVGAGSAAYASGTDLDGQIWCNPPSIGCDEDNSRPSLYVLTFNAGGTASGTQVLAWAVSGTATGGTVSVSYSANAGTSWTLLAYHVPALSQLYVWDTTRTLSTTQALWRVVLEQNTNVWDVNDRHFNVVEPHPSTSYYVNDAFTNGDVYCMAAGNDGNDGTTPTTPKASLQTLLSTYDIEPGDTIWVDTGDYKLNHTITIGAFDAGVTGAPVVVRGSDNEVAGGSVFRFVTSTSEVTVLQGITNRGFETGSAGLVVPYEPGTNGWKSYSAPGARGTWSGAAAQPGGYSMQLTVDQSSWSYALISQDVNIHNSNHVSGSVAFEGWFLGDLSRAGNYGERAGAFLKMEFLDASLQHIGSPVENEWNNGRPLYGINTGGAWVRTCIECTNIPQAAAYIRFAIGLNTFGSQLPATGWWDNVSAVIELDGGTVTCPTGALLRIQDVSWLTIEKLRLLHGIEGIHISGAEGILVRDCEFKENTTGIKSSGSTVRIEQSRIVSGTYGARCLSGRMDIYGCTFWGNKTWQVWLEEGIGTVSNSILATVHAGGSGICVGNNATYSGDYNNHFAAANACVGFYLHTNVMSLAEWQALLSPQDEHSLSVDPAFVGPGCVDLHLKSQTGTWSVPLQAWVTNDVDSPCIDTADPSAPYSMEPMPNGGHRNMGAYGNTPQASRSTDSDGDGLSDSLEVYRIGSDPNNPDSDGDGVPDGDECLAGTSPTDDASVFSFNACGGDEGLLNGSGIVFSWPSVEGRIYRIEWSTNLMFGFSILEDHLLATPPTNTYMHDMEKVGGAFYRVKCEQP